MKKNIIRGSILLPSQNRLNGRDELDQIAQEESKMLPKRKLMGLIIDESGRVKGQQKCMGWASIMQ